MLQDMQRWTDVRHALFVEKISLREAAERFGLNFRTVKKIASHAAPPEFRTPNRQGSKTAPFLPLIKEYLLEDKDMPPKQRHTAKRIFERLQEEHGYDGCDRTIRTIVARLRKQAKTVYVPLAHPPAEAQFDFGFAQAVIGGVRQKIAYAEITLPYSNVRYVQAFPKECTETFQESLRKFFRFVNGVPTLIKFDNSKVNVGKIVGQRGSEASDGLLRLEAHYFFKHHFCRIRQPQEKGHVENGVRYSRNNYMVPMPEFPDFETFNLWLEQKCLEEFDKTSARRKKTIGELFLEEIDFLLPLPRDDFEARRIELHHANSLSLVRFDCNDYSVPSQHAHKEFTVVGGIDTVKFLVGDKVVAVHRRDWDKKKTHYNPVHYLAAAEKRPNAFEFGEPFADWDLPPVFETLRRRLQSKAGKPGKREYIRILRLLEHHTLDQLARGVDRALSMSTTAYEAVRLCVECEKEVSVELFSLDGRPHLQQVQLPEPLLNVYSNLMENHYDETRNEIDGIAEASSVTIETPDDGGGMRGDRLPLCEGERRPSGILAPIIGTGTAGAGIESDGAAS